VIQWSVSPPLWGADFLNKYTTERDIIWREGGGSSTDDGDGVGRERVIGAAARPRHSHDPSKTVHMGDHGGRPCGGQAAG